MNKSQIMQKVRLKIVANKVKITYFCSIASHRVVALVNSRFAHIAHYPDHKIVLK